MVFECKKCMGAGVICLSAAIILHSSVGLDDHHFQYVPGLEHTHQKIYYPQKFSQILVTQATSESPSISY